MRHNIEVGTKGEDIAVNYLRKKDYRIIERNWRFRHKEIDIVAGHGDCLVVVEVKTRTGRTYGDPVAGVTLKKQAFLIQAAEFYLYNNNLDMDVRFDIIIVRFERDRSDIEHIKDAFHPFAV